MNTSSTFNLSVLPPPSFEIYIWPVSIAFLIGGVGAIFGNIMIIAALINTPDLNRNRCNMLFGNLALADAISGTSFIVTGVNGVIASLRGLNAVAMSNEMCFYVNITTILSFDAGSLMVLAIGIDRMVSLRWPLFYKNLTKTYVVLVNAVSWLFGLVNVILGFLYKDPNEIVPSCALPTSVRDVALAFWNDSNIAINILVIAAYAAAYRRAKSLAAVRSSNNDQILRNNRLLTSLIICVSIYIVGWMVTMVIIFLVNMLGAPPTWIFHCSMYVGLLANINVGCNFFVYYARSDEYRKAFRKLMGLKDDQVTPLQPVSITQNAAASVKSLSVQCL